MLLIFVYHHYEIFPVDERPREQVICQLGAGGCIPGATSGSRLSTGNRRLGTTVFPVDGIGPAGKSRFWRVGEFAWELKINLEKLQEEKKRPEKKIKNHFEAVRG